MVIPRLYVRPEHREFGPEGERDLARALAELSRVTRIDEIDPGALIMDRTGALPDGYRFTSTGLKQLCTLAGRGLYLLITDLAGTTRDPERPRDEYSFDEAVRIYNRTIALRAGHRLEGRQRLLKNTRDRLVEGALGPRYTLVENAAILDRLAEIAQARDRPCRFQEAVLTGRRLMVRYVDRGPLFVADDGEPVHGGIHFANSEIGGESAVRAAVLLWQARRDSYALGPYLGGRTPHVGRDFARKLAAVFRKASAAEQDGPVLARRLTALHRLPLPVVGGDEDRRQAQIKSLVRLLADWEVPQWVGHKAVAAALGRRLVPVPGLGLTIGPADGAAGRPARSAHDLFAALTREGKTLYATARETVEQVAYALLTGRLTLS